MIRKKYVEKVQRSRDRKLDESLPKKEEELLKRKGKEDAMEEEFRATIISEKPKEALKETLEEEMQKDVA